MVNGVSNDSLLRNASVHQGADSTSTSAVSPATSSTGANEPVNAAVDPAKLTQAIAELNQKLAGSNTRVVLDPHEPANQIWLNLVDSNGQVIERIPPEGLRNFMATGNTSGITIDTQR